jgi:hypothetical protein
VESGPGFWTIREDDLGDPVIEAYVCDAEDINSPQAVIHLIAWGWNEQYPTPRNYRILQIHLRDYNHWLRFHRKKYGKVLRIVSGGVDNVPSKVPQDDQ